MVIVTADAGHAEEHVELVQPSTTFYLDQMCKGTGTLSISESRVSWQDFGFFKIQFYIN
jgi:hypothetical protein